MRAFLNSAGVHEAEGSTEHCRNNRRMVFLVADFEPDIRVWRKSGLDLVCDLPGIVDHAPGCPQILISLVNSRRGLPASVCSENKTSQRLFVYSEADLHDHLIVFHRAVLDVAPDLIHLKPIEVSHCL